MTWLSIISKDNPANGEAFVTETFVLGTKLPPTIAGAPEIVNDPPPPPVVGRGGALMVRLNSSCADKAGLPLSFTRIVNRNFPVVVGVPLIVPVEGLSVSPGGREPENTFHVKGGVPPVTSMLTL